MKAADFYARFRTEVAKAIVGQDDAVRLCGLALIAQGHVLLEGVPGWARPCWQRRSRGCSPFSTGASSSPRT